MRYISLRNLPDEMGRENLEISSILAARLFYAIMWFNISPALIPISETFHVNFSLMGLTLALFLLGAGIFQIPAGIISARLGARNTALIGLYVMTAGSLLTWKSPDFISVLLSRFATGVGAAFFFSTGIALLGGIAPSRTASLIGYYNASYNVGASAGIIAFSPMVSLFGWRDDFLVSALLLLVVSLFMQWQVKPMGIKYRMNGSAIRGRLFSPYIWIIGLGFLGLWALNYSVPEYFKSFAESAGIGINTAAILGGIIPISGIAGGILVHYFRKGRIILKASVFSVLSGLLIISVPFVAHLWYWLILVFIGVSATIVISMEYAIVASSEESREYLALSIGVINSIQIGLGSAVAAIAGLLDAYGFMWTWIFIGVLAIITIPVLSVANIRGVLKSPAQ